jgi:hypothetical protein
MKFFTNLIRLPVYVLIAFVAGCSSGLPTQPTGAITVTTAGLTAPANGAVIAKQSQPITLVASNAVVTNSSAQVTYTFEVATDAGFGDKVLTKDVPQAAGQTTLKLDTLAAGKDYFWHVRATGGNTVGVFTNPFKFTIGPDVVVSAPAPASPSDGVVTTSWPVLTVKNATESGSVGNIIYRFEIAANSGFSPVLVSGLVAETANATSFLPGPPAPTGTTRYFWRVIAIDAATTIASPASTTQSFTVSPPAAPQGERPNRFGRSGR